jgi:hypothetical protein
MAMRARKPSDTIPNNIAILHRPVPNRFTVLRDILTLAILFGDEILRERVTLEVACHLEIPKSCSLQSLKSLIVPFFTLEDEEGKSKQRIAANTDVRQLPAITAHKVKAELGPWLVMMGLNSHSFASVYLEMSLAMPKKKD